MNNYSVSIPSIKLATLVWKKKKSEDRTKLEVWLDEFTCFWLKYKQLIQIAICQTVSFKTAKHNLLVKTAYSINQSRQIIQSATTNSWSLFTKQGLNDC